MAMPRLLDFSTTQVYTNADSVMEKRYAYSGSDLEYEGWSHRPNAATDAAVWMIVKYSYSGSDKVRQQLPDDGPYFKYTWDDRATYFS